MHRYGVDADKQAAMVDDGCQLAQSQLTGGVCKRALGQPAIMVSIICFSLASGPEVSTTR